MVSKVFWSSIYTFFFSWTILIFWTTTDYSVLLSFTNQVINQEVISMLSNFPPKLIWLFLKYQKSDDDLTNPNSFLIKNYKQQKIKKLINQKVSSPFVLLFENHDMRDHNTLPAMGA